MKKIILLLVFAFISIISFGQNANLYLVEDNWLSACDASTLITEDFTGGPTTGITACGPEISSTGDNCYPSGELQEGFSVTIENDADVSYYAPGTIGNNQPVVAPCCFDLHTEVNFTLPDIIRVGFYLFSDSDAEGVIRVFDTNGVLFETLDVNISGADAIFYGVIASTPIGKLELETASGSGYSIASLSYDNCNLIEPVVCGDTFYDTGGADGNYSNNEDYSILIEPDSPGDFVTLDFITVAIEAGFDFLRIYDGDDANAPELSDPTNGVQTPDQFTGTVPGGNLFVTFTSDGSVTPAGWEANVICGPIVPACGDTFYDTGGADGNYSNNEDYAILFEANDPNNVVTLDFINVAIESGFDALRIYDGDDANAPELSDPTNGVQAPGQFSGTVLGGNLFVTFTSDGSVTPAGWEANVICAPLTIVCEIPTNFAVSNITTTTANFSWNAVTEATNGYSYAVFNDGDNPNTTTPVFTESTNGLAGTATGLTENTNYEAYIVSICDNNTVSEISEAVAFTTEMILGIGENTIENLVIFPNPTADLITIKATQVISQVEIFNLLGQKVLETRGNGIKTQIDLSNQPAGVYIANVVTENGKEAIRIIKK